MSLEFGLLFEKVQAKWTNEEYFAVELLWELRVVPGLNYLVAEANELDGLEPRRSVEFLNHMWRHAMMHIILHKPEFLGFFFLCPLSFVELIKFLVDGLFVYTNALFGHPSVISALVLQISHIVLVLVQIAVVALLRVLIFILSGLVTLSDF